MKNHNRHRLLGISLLAAGALPAWAMEPGERIATQGTPEGVPACTSCHGANGGGSEDDAFPRIAGLSAGYMARQIQAFKDGFREHPVMRPWAELLTDADVAAVTSYYAGLPAASNARAPQDVSAALGQTLAAYGDWTERALPACAQCHAQDGLGAGDPFPALAGQPYSYLLGQIEAWTLGTRTGDLHGLMTPIALQLTRTEAKSLAAYYAALPITPTAQPNPAPGAQPASQSNGGVPPVAAPASRAEAQPHHGSVAPGRTQGLYGVFRPPPRSAMPTDRLGEAVRLGEAIFTQTFSHPKSSPYVGNTQTCEGCHLDAGRLAGAAPVWAAWVAYPAFRTKDQRLNTITERIQGCFTYSMNAHGSAAGQAPPAGSDAMDALEAYIYWLASGAPTGDQAMPGRGYPTLEVPAKGFDPGRGAEVFKAVCALCHGEDGQGIWVRGELIFPPLWGPQSYAWGSGMQRIDTAAAFIKRNMPLGLAAGLSDQDAWDVAAFINAQERPQDPRYRGDIGETSRLYHASPFDYYGKRAGPDGRTLGQGAVGP